MAYVSSMENDGLVLGHWLQKPDWLPQWLVDAVASSGGRMLCEYEVFEAPDGSWAVWVWKGDDKPILGLPTREVAERVAEALHEAFRSGGQEDHDYWADFD